MEGVCQEALSLAGHLALEKLVVVYDSNKICIDGSTDLSFTEDSKKKYESLGFHIIEVANGDSDFEALRKAFAEAKGVKGKPKMIIQSSTIGFGSQKEGTEKVHGAPLGDEDIAAVKKRFGRDPALKYHVEPEVYSVFEKHVKASQEKQQQWEKTLATYKSQFPAEAAQLEAAMKGELPADFEKSLPLNAASIATRKASENVLGALIPAIPALVGGSADLTPSNLTRPASANMVDFTPSTPAGRYFRFGVREHAMASIMNGMDAHGGLIPYGGTFLNFVGYALGAVRLAALSHHRVVYVATHDSIGLGEDGPTHQPVELVAALRAMPNTLVFRPSDQTETSGAWAAALHHNCPSVLCLSRQNTVPQPKSSIEGVKKGAYLIEETAAPKVIIVSSGSEVQLAVEAAKALAGEQINANVVSMPCQELFDAQDEKYRNSVFPKGVPVVSVEPYIPFGWEKYSHRHVGLTGFGGSAPAEELYKTFGVTTEAVVAAARDLVSRFPNGSAPAKNSQF
ncbi:transketolase [Angomonas deanei]|nr:transketolase [Angomonas deanei]|eukprot:EPY36314.1 transketolase [Angomonas deanei]